MKRPVHTPILPEASWQVIAIDLAVFASTFIVAGVLALLYSVLAGRTLSPAQFGLFNALFGVITLASHLAASIQLAATNIATREAHKLALRGVLISAARMTLPGTVLSTGAAMLVAGSFGASALEVGLCGLTTFVLFISSAALGFLTGVCGVRAQARLILVGAVMRVAAGWPLMLVGFGVNGAVLGFLLNYVLVLILSLRFSASATAGCGAASPSMAPLKLDAASVSAFVLAFAPLGLDQLLVQLFAEEHGGLYAAVATTSKLVFFCTFPIMAVAYPHILRELNMPRRVRLLASAAAAVLLVALSVTAVLTMFPDRSLQLLFGERFIEGGPYVAQLALSATLLSLSALATHALIAWEVPYGYVPSLIAIVLGAALFATRHSSFGVLVENQLWLCSIQLALTVPVVCLAISRTIRRS
jgi:O-antigen/teichoic acid export membrane protein